MDQTQKPSGRGRLLNWKQATERLNVSRAKFYRLVSDGHFVALQVGKRSLRVTEASVEDYIDRQISIYVLENGDSVSDVS